MSRYRHVMYISGSHLEQVFHERYERDIPIGTGSGVGVSPEIEGKLGALVGSLREHFASDVDRDGIKEINFDDELFQTKRVINDVLDDEGIPSVTELHGSNGNWEGMYRFSSEVLLQPYDGRFEDGKKFIKVTGIEDDVKFQGVTSLDNWSSRTNVLNALGTDGTYPFEGVLTPVEEESNGIEQEEYSVQFLFIRAPDKEAQRRWSERQQLKKELYQ